MALRLSVPAGLRAPSLPAETHPKQLREWLDRLPLSKLFDSARAVCDGLARLNRSHLSADERLKLLEIYQPTLQRLRTEIAEDYNQAPLPLPANSRQAVNLARELLIEEAYAYKLALLEKSGKLMLFGARKQLVPLIGQALQVLSDTLTLSYQSYLPTPAGVWHEMHELYRYASEQELLEAENDTPAIDGIYKQAVLMALTDPYRLPRVELPDVMRLTKQLATLTELRLGPLSDAQPLFVIHPDSDKPPKRALLPGGTEGEPRGSEWIVGTGRLVHQLSDVVAEREFPPQRFAVSGLLYTVPLELLQRLVQCWGAPPKRVFRRQAGQTTVRICTGIHRICRLLGGAMRAGNVDTHQLVDESLQEWEVINQSAGGFKLQGVHADEAVINIGDIIALRYRGMRGLSIGVIRWAQAFEVSSVEFGVQMLSPGAESASIEPTIGGRGAQQALLLPEIPALQQPAALVTQPGIYEYEREFILTRASNLATIRAGELIEKTACYELFRFTAG